MLEEWICTHFQKLNSQPDILHFLYNKSVMKMRAACLLGFLFALLGCQYFVSAQKSANEQGTDEFRKVREQMVDGQIRSRGIKDGDVIRAMLKVPRHKFVPQNLEKYAYRDSPLPIGLSQTISQPYIVAYMTDAADI